MTCADCLLWNPNVSPGGLYWVAWRRINHAAQRLNPAGRPGHSLSVISTQPGWNVRHRIEKAWAVPGDDAGNREHGRLRPFPAADNACEPRRHIGLNLDV